MSAPFGIAFHSSIASLQVLQDLGQGIYVVQPDAPHPLFDVYAVQATPSLGVVWVKGITPCIENDNFGTATRAAVDRLADQLAQKYGPPEKMDMLLEGSIWNEPQDWMNSLNDRERVYSYSWEPEKVTQLPEDLECIFLGAVPHEGNAASIVLEYSSRRKEQADKDLEREMADLL